MYTSDSPEAQFGSGMDFVRKKMKEYWEEEKERCKVTVGDSCVFLLGNPRSDTTDFLNSAEKISDIENYEMAKSERFVNWVIHHRLETRGFGYTSKELKALGLYYRRPASELIFLRTSDHSIIHHKYIRVAKRLHKALVACIK